MKKKHAQRAVVIVMNYDLELASIRDHKSLHFVVAFKIRKALTCAVSTVLGKMLQGKLC